MRKPIIAAAVVAAILTSSCAAPGYPPAEHNVVAKSEANGGLQKRSPTLALDAHVKGTDPNTLQLLEERSQDLAKSKKKVDDLEAELRQRSADLERVKDDSKSKAHEKEQLEGLLKEATENERTATEKALSSEIARLKFEQEVLKMKLGNLMRDNP